MSVTHYSNARAAHQRLAPEMGDEGTFTTRITLMGRNEPCFCGREKKLTECCITEQQFDEALKAQAVSKSFGKIKLGCAEWMGKSSRE